MPAESALKLTELERCPKCGWSILISLSNKGKRCPHCGYEFDGGKVIDYTPQLFDLGGAGI